MTDNSCTLVEFMDGVLDLFFFIHHSSTHQLFETIGTLITSTRDHLNIAKALFRMDWAGEPAAVEVDRHATSLY